MSKLITGVIIESTQPLSLVELAEAIATDQTVIIEMVEHQLFIPEGDSPHNWQFDSFCLRRAKIALSFYHDLDINLAGISLALDLLDQIEQLEGEVTMLRKLAETD